MKYTFFLIGLFLTLSSHGQNLESHKFSIGAGVTTDSGNDIWSPSMGANLGIDYSKRIWSRLHLEVGLFYSQFSQTGKTEIIYVDAVTGMPIEELNYTSIFLTNENTTIFDQLSYDEVRRGNWIDFAPNYRKFQTYALSAGLFFDFLKSRRHDLGVGYRVNLGYGMDHELWDYVPVWIDIPEIDVFHDRQRGRPEYVIDVPLITNDFIYEYDFILRYDYYLKGKYGLGIQLNRRDNNQTLVSTHVVQLRLSSKF